MQNKLVGSWCLIVVCPFTALLYKPLDRVTKTTLVLRVRKPWIINSHLIIRFKS